MSGRNQSGTVCSLVTIVRFTCRGFAFGCKVCDNFSNFANAVLNTEKSHITVFNVNYLDLLSNSIQVISLHPVMFSLSLKLVDTDHP